MCNELNWTRLLGGKRGLTGGHQPTSVHNSSQLVLIHETWIYVIQYTFRNINLKHAHQKTLCDFVVSMSLIWNMGTFCMCVCVCVFESERVSVSKQVTACVLAWSMAIMEYLGLRPFTAESPGNAKVHQRIIYSSVTAGLWVRNGLWVWSFIYVAYNYTVQYVWTHCYACVLFVRRSRVELVAYWSQLIPRGPAIDQQNVSSFLLSLSQALTS